MWEPDFHVMPGLMTHDLLREAEGRLFSARWEGAEDEAGKTA